LKRLAIQGHDTDRELEFHAREVSSQRYAGDWPAPFPPWKAGVWAGWFRYIVGFLYQIFSDFGRSLVRPAGAWGLAILIAAAFYLSQTEAMQERLALQDASYLRATVRTARYAAANSVPCYIPPSESWRKKWRWRGAASEQAPENSKSRIGGLVEKFRGKTSARAEAMYLAFRNAFILLDGSGEAAHRTYGCLYGVELYGGSNPLAVVPSAVSTASAIQKLFSGLMIFLFGLALRNMLKVK
jgi:hypothetical protein